MTNKAMKQQRSEEPAEKKMKKIVSAVERGEGESKKSYWNTIGVAFKNRDGSYNLLFDHFPTRMDRTTIQLRDFDPREE